MRPLFTKLTVGSRIVESSAALISRLLLFQDAAVFANDKLIAGPHVTFDDFPVGTALQATIPDAILPASLSSAPRHQPFEVRSRFCRCMRGGQAFQGVETPRVIIGVDEGRGDFRAGRAGRNGRF
jgi:hypothetical protein